MTTRYVGLNLSHDSSVALLNSHGTIEMAIAEERLNRIKNFVGFPRLGVLEASKYISKEDEVQVIVGSHSTFPISERNFFSWVFNRESRPSFDWISGLYQAPPGFENRHNLESIRSSQQLKRFVEKEITREFRNVGVEIANVHFSDHHRGHLVSGFAGSNLDSGIAFSLDAEGDGHSGAILTFDNFENHYNSELITKFPVNSSLGYLYSAVTRRYNFKASQHEGKITGLAAFGSHGDAVAFLQTCIREVNGALSTGIPATRVGRAIKSAIKKIIPNSNFYGNFDQLAEIASRKTVEYEDLAFAVQSVLEETVINLVSFYLDRTERANITLSGGVFSNVKLNQRIAEIDRVNKLYIFPNMGDGGLSVGGVWSHLLSKGELQVGAKYENMYLGTDSNTKVDSDNVESVQFSAVNYSSIFEVAKQTADHLSRGAVVGLVQGRFEFGPRALMNRSIISQATNYDINASLNLRLRRTEFMPFAPVCREELLEEIFEIPKIANRDPWAYMTITCNVKPQWRALIPAVVHVDGTARPQTINRLQNPLGYEILLQYEQLTGIPILINTSFNVHEEPIILDLPTGLKSLSGGQIDVLVTQTHIYSRRV